ncbi:ankyrin repeat-containing domain protein [Suillus occidentalis]|nr:ankyrin repeat-containing domain protein [Suillus occidentalis]
MHVPHWQDGRTPLHWAASSGSTEIACYLIAKSSDIIDNVDESGWTAFAHSCAGHEDVVRELVGAGADVNRKNDKGITPLLVQNVLVGGPSLV